MSLPTTIRLRRRSLLGLGLCGAAVLAAGAGASAWISGPGVERGRLTARGQQLMSSVLDAVLEGMLPDVPKARVEAVTACVSRVDATITGLPHLTQAELSRAITVLVHPVGRAVITGLYVDWATAERSQVAAALERMRHSRMTVARQLYQALRDLGTASYVADPTVWPAMGYPGPRAV